MGMIMVILQFYTVVMSITEPWRRFIKGEYAFQNGRGGNDSTSVWKSRILLAYLRLLVNPTDDFSFRRVVNAPKRGIGGRVLKN